MKNFNSLSSLFKPNRVYVLGTVNAMPQNSSDFYNSPKSETVNYKTFSLWHSSNLTVQENANEKNKVNHSVPQQEAGQGTPHTKKNTNTADNELEQNALWVKNRNLLSKIFLVWVILLVFMLLNVFHIINVI